MKRASITFIAILFALFTFQKSHAQQGTKVDIEVAPSGGATKSEEMVSPLIGTAMPSPVNTLWQPVLQTPPPPSKNKAESHEELKELKLEKANNRAHFQGIYLPNEESVTTDLLGSPIIGINFAGNDQNGCPPDNTLAISDGGFIVSCVNSNIYMFNQAGNFLSATPLSSFFATVTPSFNLCDPKVIYDPGADRFILYTQVCDGAAINNQVLLAFSKSNDPTNGWWVYGLNGNPLNDDSWLDYPKIGVSNNEFYLTGNLFYSNGNYNQSVLYQIDKNSGYNGAFVNYQYWYNIDGNPFTLQPLSWGHGTTYGPGIYLIASLSAGGNILQFYDLTNDMSATNEQLMYYEVPVQPYSAPPDGGQAGSPSLLAAGDSRMMDGFYLDGTAHFVYSVDTINWSSIRYSRLNVNNLTSSYRLTTFPGTKDYSYASVASFSTSENDRSALIGFLATGTGIYPEYRVKRYDNNFNTESSVLARQGDGPVSDFICYDSNFGAIRWGDYSGLSRKHNSNNPEVWMSGCFGRSDGNWGTWITQIVDLASADNETVSPKTAISIGPNPVTNNRVSVVVVSQKAEMATFRLFNAEGRAVEELYRGRLHLGENRFSFNTASLQPGIYFLSIISNSSNEVLSNEKIIVAP